MSEYIRVKGNIYETTGGVSKVFAKGGIEHNSYGYIDYFAKSYTFGDPEEPPKKKNLKIIVMQFLDENGMILKNESIPALGNINATNILYGKRIKIRFLTKDVKDGTKIEFKIQGKSKDNCQDFWQIDKLSWNVEIKNNTCETELFSLNTLWYSENYENYNYKLHKTELNAEDLNTFSVKGKLESQFFELPENREDDLRPIAYLRNYEELIGLFSADNSGDKALIDNYENKFIIDNPEIFKVSREFSGYLNYTENLKLSDIKARVATDAKKLWNAAVTAVQAGKLDDRPLYWARNKMQVRLKRNPLFENDIDFETSIVKKGSELANIIQLFEEKSRNYDGIDFSKAKGNKKVLITGFDPFLLNSIDHPNKNYYNILQSNPSGVVALALANNNNLGAYIQTMVVPVRYSDFDGSQKYDAGQGIGIIEKYIKPSISEVDMIITISQAGEGDYNIDVFATSTRAGGDDNINFIRIDGSKSINSFSPETIKTTLPIQITQGNSKAILWGDYFITKEDMVDFYRNGNVTKLKKASLINYPSEEIYSGPGENYLSNEIFYRVAKMRSELRPKLFTGHFHISKIQSKGHDLDPIEIKSLLDVVEQTLIEGIRGI